MKKLLILNMLLITYLNSHSQVTAPQVPIGASPTVAALAKFADTNVSYYSGTVGVNIPVYQINTDGYQIPINLTYDTSGVRVNQDASWVGLGWSLTGGGVITRQIRGLDDIKSHPKKGYLYDYDNYDNFFNSNDSYVYCTPRYPQSASIYENEEGPTANPVLCEIIADSEPDLFFFNFNGYSGKFILRSLSSNNQDGIAKGILIDSESNLDITYMSYDGDEFAIKTPNGVVYEFKLKEYYKSETRFLSGEGGVSPITESVDSWHLTKIILPNNETIDYDYKNDSNGGYSASVQSYSESIDGNISLEAYIPNLDKIIPCLPVITNTTLLKTSSYTFKEASYLLSQIRWRGGTVKFITTPDRKDYGAIVTSREHSNRLTKIEVINNKNDLVKEFEFTQGYFNNQYENAARSNKARLFSRLKLLSFSEINTQTGQKIPPYEFKYYEELPLPSKETNSHDHWGLYNGKNNGNNRIPSMDVALKDDKIAPLTIRNIQHLSFSNATKLLNSVLFPIPMDASIVYNTNNDVSIKDYPAVFKDLKENDLIEGLSTVLERNEVRYKHFNGANRNANLKYAKLGTLKSIKYPTEGIETYEYELNSYMPDIKNVRYDSDESELIYDFLFNNLPRINNTNPFVKEGYNNIEFSIEDNEFVAEFTLAYELTDVAFNALHNLGALTLTLYKVEGNQEIPIQDFTHDSSLWIPEEDNLAEFSKTFNKVLFPGNYIVRFSTLIGHSPSFDFSQGVSARFEASKLTNLRPNFNVDASGLRIKKITNPKQTREFKYTTNNSGLINLNVSTGVLFSKPSYYLTYNINVDCLGSHGSASISNIRRFSNSLSPTTSVITGGIVGYSEVTETITGKDENIITTYNYNNRREFRTGLETPNNHWSLNGKMKSIKKYENAKIVEAQNFAYGIFDSKDIEATAFNFLYGNEGQLYSITSEWSPLIEQETILYNTDSSGSIKNTITYDYSEYNKRKSEIISSNSDGSVIQEKIFYPHDMNVTSLIDKYMIDQPIKTERYHFFNGSGSLISNNLLEYGNSIFPKEYKISSKNEPLRSLIQYIEYDSLGNILETLNPNSNISTRYIWGYNKEYPIAKIENFTAAQAASIQTQITAAVLASNADVSLATENTLREKLALIRSHSALDNAMISTYTYDPLIGITSMTDPKGYTMYYEYDEFNRLKQVKDANGHIVSENKYHYKNQ